MVRIKAKKKKREDLTDSIGGRLRKARQDKGISLEEAHKVTKIHPSVLEALEEDRLENILGKTYLKAFLKNYAHYLGLDEKEIVREYTAKYAPENTAKPIWRQNPVLQRKNKRFSHVIIITLAFIIWFSILSFATAKFIYRYKEVFPSIKTTESKEEPTTTPEQLDSRSKLIPIPKRRAITLTLVTHKDVWLKVTQDGTVSFHGILSKNSRETWQANDKIQLSEIGRPNALGLNVNGKDIDLSGSHLGKNILITHKGIDLEPEP